MRSCSLEADEEGRVWVVEGGIPLPWSRGPLHYVDLAGMFGFAMQPYTLRYRLSPEIAGRFHPLMRDDSEGQGERFYMAVEFEADLVGGISRQEPGERPAGQIPIVYEVNTLRLIDAELVSARWREALDRFDAALGKIVKIALESPGDEKREVLEESINKAGRALFTLARPKIPKEWRRTVHSIEPEAEVVTKRQEGMAGVGAKLLGMCVRRLGIAPSRPVPADRWSAAGSFTPLTHRSIPVDDLGLSVHIAAPDLLRKNLILGGIVIDSVTGEESGLRPGDIVLTCITTNHLLQWWRLGVPAVPHESEAVAWALRRIVVAGRHFPATEPPGLAQTGKRYPFYVLRKGEVVDLRGTEEGTHSPAEW
jgi:hypothetical protein